MSEGLELGGVGEVFRSFVLGRASWKGGESWVGWLVSGFIFVFFELGVIYWGSGRVFTFGRISVWWGGKYIYFVDFFEKIDIKRRI